MTGICNRLNVTLEDIMVNSINKLNTFNDWEHTIQHKDSNKNMPQNIIKFIFFEKGQV